MANVLITGDHDCPKFELLCKFGTLTCEAITDGGDHVEFYIDLVRQDGRKYQVCCVGTNEHDFSDDDAKVHVYMWDGADCDCSGQWYMDPEGDGYYEGGEDE